MTSAIAPARRCGLTATPVRPNGQGLGDSGGFHCLLLGPQPNELMEQGHLCTYRLFRAAAGSTVSSDGLRTQSTGDYRISDLVERVKEIEGRIVPELLRINPGAQLPTITVAVSVEHALEVAESFRAVGVPAAAVLGDPKLTALSGFGGRDAVFQAFRDGRVKVLVACAVVDEGLDVPSATVLQVTRPTASLRLWKQLCGRVLRPAPGKAEALIIDHTDNWKNPKLALPDAPIDWALHTPPKVKGAPRETNDGEVKLVVGRPQKVVETGAQLEELSRWDRVPSKALAKAIRHELRAASMAGLGDRVKDCRRAVGLLDEDDLCILAQSLGQSRAWVDTQLWFNRMGGSTYSQAITAGRLLLQEWESSQTGLLSERAPVMGVG